MKSFQEERRVSVGNLLRRYRMPSKSHKDENILNNFYFDHESNALPSKKCHQSSLSWEVFLGGPEHKDLTFSKSSRAVGSGFAVRKVGSWGRSDSGSVQLFGFVGLYSTLKSLKSKNHEADFCKFFFTIF